jgi:hypothetical protein
MNIKERREARREKLFSQFVSVEGLVEYLANEEGLDIADVAAELEGLIKRSDDSSLPEYGSIDEAAIEFVPYSVELSRLNLMDMLSDTIMGCGHGDASDCHGWLRDALFPFLQSHGFDVPVYLPAWKPQEVAPQKPNTDSAINADESADQRRARLRKAVAEICASENISISKAFDRLTGGEFGGRSNISNMYYPRKK